jgi:uncharacterized membrane protein YfcA
MGVAGDELLIPTIVLLFAVDIKIAGSRFLAISLPTTLVAFAHYGRDNGFRALKTSKVFVLARTAGAIAGTIIGGLLLGVVPDRADSPARRPPRRLIHRGLATPLNHRREPAFVTISSRRS